MTLLCLLVASVPVQATGGGSGSAYRADVDTANAAAGTSPTIVVTIKQLSSQSDRKVRSARVSAPDGFEIGTVTVKKGSTTLTNVATTSGSVTVNGFSLSSNQTVTVSMKVAIPCGISGPGTWVVVAKNGTDYATGGSALSQDTASQLGTSVAKCSLAFDTQPALAERDAKITSVTALPSGEEIKVQLLNGNGRPASQSEVEVTLNIVADTGASSATLYGNKVADTDADGIASFGPRIDTSERGYRLRAKTADPDIKDSDASDAFSIQDVATVCDGPCGGTSHRDTTTAVISSSSNGGVLTMSLGLDDFDCNDAANGYYVDSSAAVTFDVTPTTNRTVITIRLDAADVTRPYNLYDVCFSAPSYGFRNRYNVRIDPGKAGLLKICPPRLDKQNADPCVVDKWRENGDVFIKFSVPPGDPRGRI
jgi:hypothetical protein